RAISRPTRSASQCQRVRGGGIVGRSLAQIAPLAPIPGVNGRCTQIRTAAPPGAALRVSGPAGPAFREATTPMRLIRTTLCALAAFAAVTSGSGCASADRPILASPTSFSAEAYQPVVVEVFSDSGTLPAYLYAGSVFVEGRNGEHYGIRVANNSNERVEAVVTVDGRDVVSGELGNFKKQRGYVIEPWTSVVIDGYRQSLDRVASFRFSELGDSYSARRGTPGNVGVIGVAVFREKATRESKKRQPIAVGGTYYEPTAESVAGEPFPDSARRSAGRSDDAPASGAFAPSPARANEIGTAYGETRTSVVHQTRFKRHRKLKPDAVLTVRYDSYSGLQARGVLPYDDYDPPYDSEPFPSPYAPPPPVWR
ncbi:MAG: hypothetical protein AAF721_31650, partial [Myxococcota bacterium]